MDDANPVTHLWTGLTETVDNNLEGNFCWTAAFAEFASAQAALAVTCTPSVTQNPRVMALASFGPA